MTPAAVAADLARFVHPDQYTELRALNVGGPGRTFSGWFDGAHLLDMARNALALSRQAAGVYFVPNPVNPDVAAKRMNVVLNVPKGFRLTHDEDIIEQRFLLVDIDPTRYATDPDGRECPSSARELLFARTVARDFVAPFLRAEGWPDPAVMVSGNGVHLVYQLHPPIPRALCWKGNPIEDTIRLVADKFTCLGATFDRNTFNPSRMLKVPGTLAKKGDATRDRPHRAARILEVPDGWRSPTAPPVCDQPDQQVEPGRVVGAKAARPAPAERPALFDRGGSSPAMH